MGAAAHPPCRFLVAGAAHWDLIARTDATLPPGADVPGRITRSPGGVGLNIALALATLGRPVTLLTALGTDAEGDALAARIVAAGITPALIRTPGPTDAYLAIEAADGSLLAGVADCTTLERTGDALLRHLPPRQGPLILDGNLAPATLTALAAASPGPLVLVPASPRKAAVLAPLLARHRFTLHLNRAEAEAIAGRRFTDSAAAAAALVPLGAAEALVTDGARPATAASAAGTVTLAPPRLPAGSVTGAGDVFVAAHLAARADGLAPEPALAAALAAAARHITREVA